MKNKKIQDAFTARDKILDDSARLSDESFKMRKDAMARLVNGIKYPAASGDKIRVKIDGLLAASAQLRAEADMLVIDAVIAEFGEDSVIHFPTRTVNGVQYE